MRTMILLPVACLALLAGPASAQQPASPPSPVEPSAPRQGTEGPRDAAPGMPEGVHAHPGTGRAPALRIRFGGISLDLRCSAGDDTEACARTALGIVDHLSRMTAGGDTGPDESTDQNGGGDEDGGGADQNGAGQ
jgi:hypothetical protein